MLPSLTSVTSKKLLYLEKKNVLELVFSKYYPVGIGKFGNPEAEMTVRKIIRKLYKTGSVSFHDLPRCQIPFGLGNWNFLGQTGP